MKYPKRVRLCEVGLRDGLQNEVKCLSTKQKVEILDQLVAAGFTVIEAGSFVSPKAVPQMEDTDEIFKKIRQRGTEGVELRALVANLRGVERAAACGCQKIKLNVSASASHNLANLNRTPAESVAGFADCVKKAHENAIEVSGSISMPFGSPWDKEIPADDVKRIVEAYLETGIRELSLSDAPGVADPAHVYQLCETMRREYPEVQWWLHFHNTRGLGIANILAAMEAGIDQFDTSFAGAGGCPFVPGAAGNVATEDVAHMMERMGIYTGIDLDRVIGIARSVVQYIGHNAGSYLLHAGKAGDLIRELPKGQIKNQSFRGKEGEMGNDT